MPYLIPRCRLESEAMQEAVATVCLSRSDRVYLLEHVLGTQGQQAAARTVDPQVLCFSDHGEHDYEFRSRMTTCLGHSRIVPTLSHLRHAPPLLLPLSLPG